MAVLTLIFLFLQSMLHKDEIIKIASLSNLLLSPDELKQYQGELSEILKFFETLQEVDTEGVSPTAQVTGLENITRKDDIAQEKIETLLDSSSLPRHNGQVSVPAVF